MRPKAQYFEFSMAASIQGWRTKWFYIKDRKSSPEDKYGLPPFDASQEVKKLASWDMLPSDAEAEQLLPLLSCIKALQGGQGGGGFIGYSTHGIFRTTSSSTPAAPPHQALGLFGLGRSYSHL
jgi:hypothetical protein